MWIIPEKLLLTTPLSRRAWRRTRKQADSKAFLLGPDRKRIQELLWLSEEGTHRVTSPYTGHCRLSNHLFNMGLVCGQHST